MSKDETLIDKLEALMSKNRGGATGHADDPDDIPVLTEILDDGATRPAQAVSASSHPEEIFSPTPMQFTALSDERIRALAREIQNQVMRNIEPQLTGPIQEKLIQKIDTYVNEAVRNALAEIKQEIADSITTAVTDALSLEAASNFPPSGATKHRQ